MSSPVEYHILVIPVMCVEDYKLLLESQGVEPMPVYSSSRQPQHVHCKKFKPKLTKFSNPLRKRLITQNIL